MKTQNGMDVFCATLNAFDDAFYLAGGSKAHEK